MGGRWRLGACGMGKRKLNNSGVDFVKMWGDSLVLFKTSAAPDSIHMLPYMSIVATRLCRQGR